MKKKKKQSCKIQDIYKWDISVCEIPVWDIPVCMFSKKNPMLQWNLSKSNLGTNFCVQNKQVFGL